MKCVKIPVFVYYIAHFTCVRQENKEFNFIYRRKGQNTVNNLLKKSQ